MDMYFMAASLQQLVGRCITFYVGNHMITGELKQVTGIECIDLEPSCNGYENTRIWLKNINGYSVWKGESP